ncbi:probable G-protein coupled receptor B0563.6 [Physella acuta]|uniref:probable G-protein coupled receptor B0563.6 n=1 Tax=Physella acuta TaxID=109671 RepID=UPI0027DE236C|nr:probable G-protein coupled receptor B0563.6 [Physella acuta]
MANDTETRWVRGDKAAGLTQTLEENRTSPQVNDRAQNPFLDSCFNQEVVTLFQVMTCIVNPTVASVGLLGNVFSLLILVKNGLRKSSNVFLLALALSDSMYLLGNVSVLYLLMALGPSKSGGVAYGWMFQEQVSYVCFLLDRTVLVISSWGSYVSTTIPVAIMVDRFIAVVFPLQFKNVMTCNRAVIVVVVMFVVWLPWCLIANTTVVFQYSILSEDQYFGFYIRSDFFIDNIDIIYLFYTLVLNFISCIIPVSFTIVGSFIIGVKVKITMHKRRKISTSRTAGQSRVTRTLMTVSLTFAAANIAYFVVSYVYTEELMSGTEMTHVVEEFQNLLLLLCSSSNFFIYIVLNPKFRNDFVKIIVWKL